MRPDEQATTVRSLLLTRRGFVFAPELNAEVPGSLVHGVELELAELGYVLSPRLRVRLGRQTTGTLGDLRAWLVSSLAAALGADQQHTPLFRNFPHDVPADTGALWWRKVLSHYLQAPNQPCLFCAATATTHVLSPCEHVVCDRCFDGANYSACPVCEHHVDQSSPFFLESPVRDAPKERVTFRQLDLADDETSASRAFFVSLCERKQALSPDDREALLVILRERGDEVLSWLPAKIPVRENVAIVFGTLFQACEPDVVLPVARRYMTTATDVLRFIAVLSGTDGSLQAEVMFKTIDVVSDAPRFLGKIAALLGVRQPATRTTKATIPVRVKRFKVARLRRPLRRALLNLLEGFDEEALMEDMLRHRSYWVWAGEFLHPTEYAPRFPRVARAFELVRKQSPDGQPAPAFQGWGSRLERAITTRDVATMLSVLCERPGELARRFDRALRLAGSDATTVDAVVAAFADNVPNFATPVLLTLRSHLATRAQKAPVRVYWPKGGIAKSLTSDGVPTKWAGRMRAGRTSVGAWTAAGIKSILENEIYIGTRVWNRHSRSGEEHQNSGKKRLRRNADQDLVKFTDWAPPMIDHDLWERVQARLRREREEYKAKHSAGKGREHLLSGFLKCATCGAKLTISGHVRRSAAYRCGNNKRRSCANGALIPVSTLESRVRDCVDMAVKTPNRLAELIQEHNSRVDEANEGQLAVVRTLESCRARVAVEEQNLIAAIAAGGQIPILVSALKQKATEKEALGRRISEARSLVQTRLAPKTRLAAYSSGSASLFSGDITKDRAMLAGVLDAIIVQQPGAISLRFKLTGLFDPEVDYQVSATTTTETSPRVDLAAARRATRRSFDLNRWSPATAANGENLRPQAGPLGVRYWVKLREAEPTAEDTPLDEDGQPYPDGVFDPSDRNLAENNVCDPSGIRKCPRPYETSRGMHEPQAGSSLGRLRVRSR